jgi:hypothetical protein
MQLPVESAEIKETKREDNMMNVRFLGAIQTAINAILKKRITNKICLLMKNPSEYLSCTLWIV